jgi:hypothetical protein
MIKNTLQKIEATVRDAPRASAETKEQLLALVRELSAELEALERTHREHAHTIAGHADEAVTEAMGPSAAVPVTGQARTGFGASVSELEASYPKLASLVRSISDSLANVGI